MNISKINLSIITVILAVSLSACGGNGGSDTGTGGQQSTHEKSSDHELSPSPQPDVTPVDPDQEDPKPTPYNPNDYIETSFTSSSSILMKDKPVDLTTEAKAKAFAPVGINPQLDVLTQIINTPDSLATKLSLENKSAKLGQTGSLQSKLSLTHLLEENQSYFDKPTKITVNNSVGGSKEITVINQLAEIIDHREESSITPGKYNHHDYLILYFGETIHHYILSTAKGTLYQSMEAYRDLLNETYDFKIGSKAVRLATCAIDLEEDQISVRKPKESYQPYCVLPVDQALRVNLEDEIKHRTFASHNTELAVKVDNYLAKSKHLENFLSAEYPAVLTMIAVRTLLANLAGVDIEKYYNKATQKVEMDSWIKQYIHLRGFLKLTNVKLDKLLKDYEDAAKKANGKDMSEAGRLSAEVDEAQKELIEAIEQQSYTLSFDAVGKNKEKSHSKLKVGYTDTISSSFAFALTVAPK